MSSEDESLFRLDARAKLSTAWPSYLNVLLGVWLFVSAFAWPHSRDASAASWIMGASLAMGAFAAIWAAPTRYFNIALGLMSFIWHVAAAPDERLTLLNGVLVSCAVILLSLVPPLHDSAPAS